MTNKILRSRNSPPPFTQEILEFLAGMGRIAVNGFFPKYKAGSGPMRALVGLDLSPRERNRRRTGAAEQKRISRTLSHLARQGFVAREGPKKTALWSITEKGQKILSFLQAIPELPPEDGMIRLAMFDVPEKYRKSRNWLRAELASCGFEMMQKSVWIGKRPLRKEFIEKLRERKLVDYIHIVEITKKGTLTELI